MTYVTKDEKQVRDDIVLRNMPFAKSIAVSYIERIPELSDDIEAAAYMSLVETVTTHDRVDPTVIKERVCEAIEGEIRHHQLQGFTEVDG